MEKPIKLGLYKSKNSGYIVLCTYDKTPFIYGIIVKSDDSKQLGYTSDFIMSEFTLLPPGEKVTLQNRSISIYR